MADRLIDTTIWIEHLRGVPMARAFLLKARTEGRVATSVINAMEVLVGARNRRERLQIEKFLKGFEVLPLGVEDGWQASRIIQTHAHTLGLWILDAIIAASAIREKMVLSTLNDRHFQGISGLRVERPY
jgi:hypothetical protein